MKRLLAVLGAVAMIGAAVLVRGALTGDGGDGGGGGGSNGGGDGATHLLCVPELEAACEALAEQDDDVTFDVEEAGVTAERLGDEAFRASETDIDGWLTLEPWPTLVNDRRVRANQNPVLDATVDVLATAKLAIVGPADRIDLLTAECGADQTGWKCFGDLAGESWASHGGTGVPGSIEVGHDDPRQSATGLLVLGQAASDYFGTSAFASNDFDADPDFRDWLEQLENADPGLTPGLESLPVLEQLEALPNASWDAVGTLDPQARASKARAADDLAVLYPSPMIRAEVVLAPIRGHKVELSDDDLRSALEAAGWEPGGAPQGAAAAPNAGVYEALIQEWELAT